MVGNEDKGLGFELSACWVCLAFFFFFWGGGGGIQTYPFDVVSCYLKIIIIIPIRINEPLHE